MVAQIAPPPIALVVNKIAGPQPTIPPVAGGEELFELLSGATAGSADSALAPVGGAVGSASSTQRDDDGEELR